MTKFLTTDLRGIVLMGHGHVGKTALADLMLFKAGKNSRQGSPDDGTSLLDSDDDARQRKHTITSSVAHFEHNGKFINLIDAPGMPDFVGQVLGPVRSVETAVIVMSATGGVEVNTRKSFKQATEAGIAKILVINKCDGENINFTNLLESIWEQFGKECVLFNVPIGIGHDITGVVSTVDMPATVPPGAVVDLKTANQQLIDAAVETDETLMMRYLDGEQLSADELAGAITNAVAAGKLIPIFCTSVKKGIGVTELMDGIARYAPSSVCIPRKGMKGKNEVTIAAESNGHVVAQVFKTRIDPFVAKMSYLRIYQGTIKKDMTLKNERTGRTFKVSQVMLLQGSHHDTVPEAGPGSIIAVVKVDDLRTGDTVTLNADGIVLPTFKYPTPMIGLAVEPKSQADQAKISTALHKIEEEDPTFVVHREEQTKEIVMHGMSELHLQLIKNRLHDREKVDIITHNPKIPYRETVAGAAEGSYRHKKQSGGSGQFAEVHFRISHCPQEVAPDDYFTKDRFASLRDFHYDSGLNSCFIDRVTGGSVPNQFIPAVEKGVKERMVKGVVAGFQVQDVVVELYFGKDHPVDSNETAFKIAASQCFREVFKEARPVLLEPIVTLEITVPSNKIGDITSDLNTRRGRMEGMQEVPGGQTVIQAKAPLAEVMTYARALSSITAGQGSFTMDYSHYEPVPPNEQAKIVAAAKVAAEE